MMTQNQSVSGMASAWRSSKLCIACCYIQIADQDIEMGFALNLLYIVTYYLTPTTVLGPLAKFRIDLIIATLAVAASVPAMTRSFVFRTPQALGLAGTAIADAMSLLGNIGQVALRAFLAFIPNAFVYVIVD